MTKKHSTKKALATSLLSLVLCLSMFVGTTFAWFTDSVTSAGNVITAGNLDIEVEYTLDGENWAALDGAKDMFQNDLWEPGHTEVVALKITNKGSLALKYAATMNIINETVGKTKDNKDIVLSDILTVGTLVQAANQIGDISVELAFKNENMFKGTTSFKASNVLAANQELLPGSAHYAIIKVDMAETVGNEANHNGVDVPSIEFGVNVIATQFTYENDSFGKDYDKNAIIATSAAEAQAALDNAEPGAMIMLVPGVNYGTLYLRPVEGQANTVTNCDYLVYRNEMLRKVEDLTIVGAPGATVDAIKTVAGYVENSGSTGYVVDIKNLVVDSVEFNDTYTNAPHSYASPLFFDFSYINVDGLTVKNCKLIGDNDKMNLVYFYAKQAGNSTFATAAKNITITGNTIDGIARLCELRQAENVTITNNTIKNTAQHGMLLSVDGGTYSGNVTITNNIAENIGERLVRMAGADNATVVIKDNVVIGYLGADEDYIKVTLNDGTNITDQIASGNQIIRGYEVVTTVDELQSALDAADKDTLIKLGADINGNVTATQKPDVKITIDGAGKTFAGTITVNGKSARYETAALTVKNVIFDAVNSNGVAYINLGKSGDDNTRYTNNVTVQDCTFKGYGDDIIDGAVAVKSYTGGDWNLTLDGLTVDAGMHSMLQVTNIEKGLKIIDCKVNSKNGINLNNTLALEMSGCDFDVRGYAVRFGVKGSTTNGTFSIANSTLKAACNDGDSVIILRGTMTGSTLTLTNTTLVGDSQIAGTANIVRN